MTHGKIFQHGTRKAHQHSTDFDEARRVSITCGDGTGKTIQYVQAPGLPLCARSRADWGACSGPRPKDSLYSQTLPKSDQSPASICQFYREHSERNSDPSFGSLSAKRSEAWLRGGNVLERSSWNTAMTDWQQQRSCRLIGF